jgi:isocitrate dehydrogenase
MHLSTSDIEIKIQTFLFSRKNFSKFPGVLIRRSKTGDALSELGTLATTPDTHVLPNVSASVPLLNLLLLNYNLMAIIYQTP